MKNALEWLREHGDIITVKDIIDLQNDARKDGLMSAQSIASDIIRREAPKYAVLSDSKLSPSPPEMTLSGLAYFVCSAITTEADKLDYLPGKRNGDQSVSEQVSAWEQSVKDNPPKRVF